MKKKVLCLSFLSAAAFSAASLYSENKYFNYNASANLFSSDGAWSLNEDLSAGGETTAPTADDTAIFYKAKPSSWTSIYVSRQDTAVGNIIASGGGNIAYNNQVLSYGTLNFTVDGKIMVQFCDTYGAMGFGTSFGADREGSVDIVITAGGIEVGKDTYDGRTYDSYESATLNFDFSDSHVASSLVHVLGDVQIGGCAVTLSGDSSLLRLGVDKMQVDGVVRFERTAGGYSNIYFDKSSTLEVGGLAASDMSGSFTISNSSGSAYNSTIVLKNAAGTDYQYIGLLADDGSSRPDISAINAALNVTMEGAGTQRVFSAIQSNTGIQARQSGTYTVKSGRLFMDNSRLASDYRQAKLSLEGGMFGAWHYDSGQAGNAYFRSAEFHGGGLAYENFATHLSIETQVSDKIIISETFAKAAGSGRIAVDFSDKDGNAFNLGDYVIAENAASIDNWVEILTAGDLSGFDLGSEMSENIYDATGDFYAIGLENGVAVFRWVGSGSGYSLEVGFAQVPEPAAAAAIACALAVVMAAYRRRK